MNLPVTSEAQIPQTADFHVVVDFGKGIPPDAQGPALLHMEMELRKAGIPAEVLKRECPDDSKLRLKMTHEEREKL